MDLRKLVGKNVRQFRQERGWSQEQLAFEAELDRTYVSGVERGVRNPTVMIIGRLAKALKIAPDLLLRRD